MKFPDLVYAVRHRTFIGDPSPESVTGAEPDATEEAVTEAINDTLKAIAASLLMEQVLAPRFEFKPKNPDSGPTPGFNYGEGGYDSDRCNVGVNEQTGAYQIEIKGLAEPKSKEAARICQEDLNEVIAAFVQDKPTIERGLFDEELVLVVGPEGGLDDSEVATLTEAGATPVLLGPTVLRTSTAAAVALGAIGVLSGRWGARPLD